MAAPRKTNKPNSAETTRLRSALADAERRLESEKRSHEATKHRLAEEIKSHTETRKFHTEDRNNFTMHLTALNAVAAVAHKPTLAYMTQWMIGDLQSLSHSDDVNASTDIYKLLGGDTSAFDQDVNAQWFDNHGDFNSATAGQSVARYAFYILSCLP